MAKTLLECILKRHPCLRTLEKTVSTNMQINNVTTVPMWPPVHLTPVYCTPVHHLPVHHTPVHLTCALHTCAPLTCAFHLCTTHLCTTHLCTAHLCTTHLCTTHLYSRLLVQLLAAALREGGPSCDGSNVMVCSLPTGPLCDPEEVAPMAGQAFDPCPGGPRHVHPHLPDPCQLSQHQAVHRGLSWKAMEQPRHLWRERWLPGSAGCRACGGDQLLPTPCTSRSAGTETWEAPPRPPAEQEFWPVRAATFWALGRLESNL